MVSSRVTLRLERIRGTSGLSQCDCIEMMSTVDTEARRRRFAPSWLPLLNYSPVCNIELLFVRC
jgi:hypothetical protein